MDIQLVAFSRNNDGLCPGSSGHNETFCSSRAAQDADGDAGKEAGNGDAIAEDSNEVQRETWSNKRDYILSMMGYSIGVGNIWRFPYICIRNGGGAFLIPYLLNVMLFGLPLFFLESVLGQFTAKGPLHVWGVCPLVKGVGVSMLLLVVLVYWYYNTILTWSMYFLASCFRSILPWTQCHQWWNTEGCRIIAHASTAPVAANVSVVTSDSSFDRITKNSSFAFDNSTPSAHYSTGLKMVSSAEEFWQHNVLQVSGGLHEPGHVVWYLACSLAVASLTMFLGMSKGIKTSGKMVYVTVTAPYVLLTILIVRGLTLPGSGQGILFYLTPDFARLADYNVWIEAALQVFWSLGPCYGPVIALSSYNKFQNNCLKDSVFLTLVCEGTSLYAGLAIFSVLGYMAHETGLPIDKVVSSGPGLAFIVYPEALSLMPLSHLWAVIFFLMIITVCIDTEIANGETVLTILHDLFPQVFHRHRPVITAVFCAGFFLLQLPLVTQGGIYLFQLVDWFLSALSLMLIGVVECVVLTWVYGIQRLEEDIQLMLGRRPPVVMKALWRYVVPCLLMALWVTTMARYQMPVYGDYHYDTWGQLLGWTIAAVSVAPMPLVALVQLMKAKGTLLERLRLVTRPDETWHPAVADNRPLHQSSI